MQKQIVVLIQSDPRESHRPCEGIRVALGLASGGHQVEVVLAKKGSLLLKKDKEDYIDEDRLEQFLSALHNYLPRFSVDQTRSEEMDSSASEYGVNLLSKEAIASKIAASDCFFIF